MDQERWFYASVQNLIMSTTTPAATPATSSSSSSKPATTGTAAAAVAASGATATFSLLDPPNVSRYKTDMETAHAMRGRLRKYQKASSTVIAQFEEHVRLGLEALDQADQLASQPNQLEPAFQVYQMAIELLLRCIKSPQSHIDKSGIDPDFLSVRLQMALSEAERIKRQLQKNNHNNNHASTSQQQQFPFESTREDNQNNPSSPSSWQSLVSSLSSALTMLGSPWSPTNQQQQQQNDSQPQKQKRPSAGTPKSSSERSASTRTLTMQQHQSDGQRRHSSRQVTGNQKPTSPKAAAAAATSPTHRSSSKQNNDVPSPRKRSNLNYDQDPLVQMVKTELYVDPTDLSHTTWADISGLEVAKRSLQEAAILPLVRPDLFTGLRKPQNILLYGPPGTGKTMLVRAVAYESKCLLFACSASSLTSKWLGEGEKLVKTLFRVAQDVAPSLIFLDEMDSLLSSRKSDGNEHEASRRFKTEFMIQMDGIRNSNTANSNNNNINAATANPLVLVVGCTNCPWDVDSAVLRRFPRRIYVPLPDAEARRGLILRLLQKAGHHTLTTKSDVPWLVKKTQGYSGSDLTALASEAAFGPLRSMSVDVIRDTPAQEIRPISRIDFEQALTVATKSVPPQLLIKYQEWEQQQQASGGG